MSSTNEQPTELRLAAEEFSPEEFKNFHIFSDSDEKILRRLMSPGPVLLRGPRGSGKSAYMRMAHENIREAEAGTTSCYISLRYLPLLTAGAENYLAILIPYIALKIIEDIEYIGLPRPLIPNDPSVASLSDALNDWCSQQNKRLVLLFDDVAHIGREISLSGFFDFFRTISSSTISCKASIYPGVTRFGARFDIYSDATVVEAQRDERSSDFSEFFTRLLKIRYPEIINRAESRLQVVLPNLIGRAVLGNVRAFYALCEKINQSQRITTHTVAEDLKWLASDYLYPALEELHYKLGAYAPMLSIANDIAPIIFSDCGQKQVNSVLIHRDNVQRLGKVFEILEYAGLIARREASRVLTKNGTGRGPRYAISLGPLLEKIPRLTPSYDLFDELMRINISNDQIIEYAQDSFLNNYISPPAQSDDSVEILNLPLESLRKSKHIPYGLTDLMISALKNHGYKSISDIANLTLENLKQVPDIGDAKARRTKSVVEQAIWM